MLLELLFIPKTPEHQFPTISWDMSTQTLYADASDIRYSGERTLRVRSYRTGISENFLFSEVVFDQEGDAVYLLFKGPRGLTFKVFND